MSETTLSKILYNKASEAAAAEENTYESVLSCTQAYLSEQHARTLAETVLQEQARETVHYLIEQYLTTRKVFVTGLDIRELTTSASGIAADFASAVRRSISAYSRCRFRDQCSPPVPRYGGVLDP